MLTKNFKNNIPRLSNSDYENLLLDRYIILRFEKIITQRA